MARANPGHSGSSIVLLFFETIISAIQGNRIAALAGVQNVAPLTPPVGLAPITGLERSTRMRKSGVAEPSCFRPPVESANM
jgi:hypothetical protein